jgi:hypothetical protein
MDTMAATAFMKIAVTGSRATDFELCDNRPNYTCLEKQWKFQDRQNETVLSQVLGHRKTRALSPFERPYWIRKVFHVIGFLFDHGG